ncbi:hypothetical protein WMY93_029052 [Mugilogobius chulae]|uniref:Uncharacterized protein n=1 Tax=Mugilogobius chulae TaxID=88201 RepID=A0AAW0MQ80_9GOBI
MLQTGLESGRPQTDKQAEILKEKERVCTRAGDGGSAWKQAGRSGCHERKGGAGTWREEEAVGELEKRGKIEQRGEEQEERKREKSRRREREEQEEETGSAGESYLLMLCCPTYSSLFVVDASQKGKLTF